MPGGENEAPGTSYRGGSQDIVQLLAVHSGPATRHAGRSEPDRALIASSPANRLNP
jgi:hypothetical protein